MNDEPHDFNPIHEPMDSRLLQLERELFSLSPVETPRCLVSRLDRKMTGGCSLAGALPKTQVVRTVASIPGNVVPFRWRHIMVPAAAAVVVVSVLNRLDGQSPGALAGQQSQPGIKSLGVPSSAPRVERTNNSYLLKTEPVYFNPAAWDEAPNQYYIQPGSQPGTYRMSVPRREAATIPYNFH